MRSGHLPRPGWTLHVQDVLERAEADHAKFNQVSMARDAATMFEDLRAMADLHADRAWLRAELEQARRP